MQLKDKKKNFLDILGMAKGVAILLVVAGHSGCPQFLFRFIYLFHMAFFFIASGCFFKDDLLEHPFTFAWKKTQTLYLPFVTIVTLYIIASSGLTELGIISVSERVKDYSQAFRICFLHMMGGGNLFSPLWFLRSLLFSLFAFYGITLFCKKIPTKYREYTWWTLICLLASLHWLSLLGLVPHRVFYRDLVAVSLVCIGYACRQWSEAFCYLMQQHIGNIMGWTSLAVLLLLAATGKTIGFVGAQFGSPPFFYLSSLSGFYLLCWIAMHCTAFSPLCKILAYCGRHSMPIFVWHFVAFKLVSYIKLKCYTMPYSRLPEHPVIQDGRDYWWLIYTMAGVMLPLLWDFIVTQKKALRHETSRH